MTFGDLLADEMLRMRYTVTSLSKASGVTRMTLHRFLGQRNEPSLEAFRKLVRVMPGLAAYIHQSETVPPITNGTASEGTSSNARRPSRKP
jgi:hypothetical protein